MSRDMANVSALARTSALVVLGALLVVLAPTGAAAAPATCVTSYSNPEVKPLHPRLMPSPGFSVGLLDIQVTDPRVVVDVDWRFDATYAADSADLAFLLVNPQSDSHNVPRSMVSGMTGHLSGEFLLDDSASSSFATTSPPSGHYRPDEPAAALTGHPAAGRWRLMVTNVSDNSGSWGDFALTLTVDCDADKDGVADEVDNCPTLANVEQVDIDADGVGDTCDDNRDGDALANASDGCQRVAAATASGCPPGERELRVRHQNAKKRLKLSVASYYTECQRAEVVVWRARKGPDKKVATGTTSRRGLLTLEAPRRPGRHYATVEGSYAIGVAECGAARSKSVRIRRPKR